MSLNFIEESGLDQIAPGDMLRPKGYGLIREERSPQFRKGVLETARAFKDIMEGTASYRLKDVIEAQGTNEFQWYMGHILQRRTYAMYNKMGHDWMGYVRTSTVPDFRQVERLWRNDAAAPMDFLQEQEQYSYTGVSGDRTTYQVAKYGRLMGLTWEDLVNDDLNFLTDFPQTLANSATMTEAKFVTDLYTDAAGTPHTSVFTSARGNTLVANADLGTAANNALSVDAIRAAIDQMERQTYDDDDNDLPLMFSSFVCVIPRSLSIVADFLENAREMRTQSTVANTQDAKGGGEYEFIIRGNMLGRVRFVVNPWLDVKSGSSTNTSWYLFGVPTNARPGIEVAFLRGHRRPQIFMRMSDSRPLGSGDARASFENDTLDYKIRGVFGGAVIDYRQMMSSEGTG